MTFKNVSYIKERSDKCNKVIAQKKELSQKIILLVSEKLYMDSHLL